jgi:hypothetical protein
MPTLRDLDYKYSKKVEIKLGEYIQETLSLIDKELEQPDYTPNIDKEKIEKHKKTINAYIEQGSVQSADGELRDLYNSLPEELREKAANFYGAKNAELLKWINELYAEQENKAEEKRKERIREAKAEIGKSLHALHNNGTYAFAHEITEWEYNEETGQNDPYPYKSQNIVDLQDEVEHINKYLKLGYRITEDIKWQLYLDSLAQGKTISVKPKIKSEVMCPVNKMKTYTDSVKMNKTQQTAYNQILNKVCAKCVKNNIGR